MRAWMKYFALLILSILTVSSLYLSWSADRAFGELTVEEYMITRANGRTVVFSVYKPREDSFGQPMPTVLTIHGISGSRNAMDAYNIELARRNFTVVSVDLAGHGESGEQFGFATFNETVRDTYEAVRYVQTNDPDTSTSTYGVLGHSLGAGISLFFQTLPVQPNSTVIIGGGMGADFGGIVPPINETSPRNLLIASGIYDELVSPQVAFDTLRQATGLSSVEESVVYGDFDDGTARKLALSPTNHLFEISDSVLVSESVDWLGRALQGVGQVEEHTLDPSFHVYQYKSLGMMVGTITFVFTMFPLFLIFNDIVPEKWKHTRESKEGRNFDSRKRVLTSLVVGLLGGLLLLTTLLLGFGLEFGGLTIVPVSFGTQLTLYSFIMFFVTMFVIRKRFGREAVNTHTEGWRTLVSYLPESLVLTLPVAVWFLAWSVITGLTNTSLGFTIPLGESTTIRLVTVFLLTFTFIPLFYSDKVWLDLVVKTELSDLKSTFIGGIEALVHRTAGLVVFVAALYIPFLAGVNLGFVMFIALLLLVYIPILGLSALVAFNIGSISKNNLVVAVLNAFILAMIVAGTFQLV